MAKATDYPKTITLPYSGQIATVMRRTKGIDIRMAERIAPGGRKTNTQRTYAILAQVIQIDGHPIVMEDFDEMDAEDIRALFEAAGLTQPDEEEGSEKNSQTAPASPSLSNGALTRNN